jgi:hypothetical protein
LRRSGIRDQAKLRRNEETACAAGDEVHRGAT